ncbi:MAG: hypothetical protein R3A44_18625 [Caldilineaceae bacterium]
MLTLHIFRLKWSVILAALLLYLFLDIMQSDVKQAFASDCTPLAGIPLPLDAGVSVGEIEVNQAIVTNKPYISGRSTVVLAHLESLTAPIQICGRLRIAIDGVEKQVLMARDQPVIVNNVPPTSGESLLIFESVVITEPSSDIDLTIELYSPLDDSNVLETASLDKVDFSRAVVQPIFYYTRVDFAGTGGAPDDDQVGSPGGDAFIRAILPANDGGQWFYQEANIGPTAISDAGNNNSFGWNLSEGQKLIGELGSIRENYVTTCAVTTTQVVTDNTLITTTDTISTGSHELLFLYGWISDTTGTQIQWNGVTIRDQRVGYGTTSPEKGQLIFTHEFFHMLNGELHFTDHPLSSNVAGWDVDNHLPGGWFVDPALQQRKTSDLPRIFSNNIDAQSTKDSWISEDEYEFLARCFENPEIHTLLNQCVKCSSFPNANPSNLPPCFEQNTITLAGILDGDGTRLISRSNLMQNPWYSQPSYTYSSITTQLPFSMLFFRGENLIQAIPFDATVVLMAPDGFERIEFGNFRAVVPEEYVNLADSIVIRNNLNGARIPYLTRSENPPEIQIVSPLSEQGLDNTIVFTTADPDIPQPEVPAPQAQAIFVAPQIAAATEDVDTPLLECKIIYSADAGLTWVPIRVDLPCNPGETAVSVDLEQLSPSEGLGVIRAYVSDGMNINFAEVVSITVSAQGIEVLQ